MAESRRKRCEDWCLNYELSPICCRIPCGCSTLISFVAGAVFLGHAVFYEQEYTHFKDASVDYCVYNATLSYTQRWDRGRYGKGYSAYQRYHTTTCGLIGDTTQCESKDITSCDLHPSDTCYINDLCRDFYYDVRWDSPDALLTSFILYLLSFLICFIIVTWRIR